MRQFLLPESWDGGPSCTITGGPARYLLRVLRLSPGDSFAGLDGAGNRRDCVVTETGAERLVLSVGPARPAGGTLEDAHGSRGKTKSADRKERYPNRELAPDGAFNGAQIAVRDAAMDGAADREARQAESGLRIGLPRIILVQGIAKGPAMDLVVRQAAETGVARLIPLLARRSVARPGEGREAEKVERWQRIAREGLQQSGSPVATKIEEPTGIAELTDRLGPPPVEGRLCLLLHEAPLAQESLHGYLGGASGEIVLCVGPEGGLAPDEVESLVLAGFRPLLLPGAILRTETAALFAIASVETILSERSSWKPSR